MTSSKSQTGHKCIHTIFKRPALSVKGWNHERQAASSMMRCTWVPVTQAARWHGSTLERSRSLQTQPTGGRCASVTFILFPVPSHAVEHQVIAVLQCRCFHCCFHCAPRAVDEMLLHCLRYIRIGQAVEPGMGGIVRRHERNICVYTCAQAVAGILWLAFALSGVSTCCC